MEKGDGFHKHWNPTPTLQHGQAGPSAVFKDTPVPKAEEASASASLERPDNSCATSSSYSGYKDTPIFIEACAGCGILSSIVQQRGFQVIPIDCPRNRHVPKCRLVVLDLTTQYAEQLLHRIVNDYHVAGVHSFALRYVLTCEGHTTA